ncbi:MAG TPA: TRAP transporter substrate-binding protein [Devosiaceae bacterium]|jgi:TRAP-type C4-dicarboxylate transport system substrate-binding protein|nr:TRAP transporter substrate-binding protein [Devosiaceae bacterium]
MLSTIKSGALALALSAAMIIVPAFHASAAARTLSLGANNNENDFIADGFKFFAERVGELSNGELKVEIFWSSQLGGAREMVQGVASGSIDMQMDVIELLVTFEPRIGVLSLPLVFRDQDHFVSFIGSDVFSEMLDTLESKGIVFPGREALQDPEIARNWVRPYDRGLVSNRPIFTPADLSGFKIRMYESEIPIKSWEALGASVQVVPWPDVYTSLATGLVDGLTGTVTDNYEMKHFENARYWTNIHEYFQMMHPWMSKMTWDSLTDSQRAAIDQATREASHEIGRLMTVANAESVAKAQEEFGVTLIIPPMEPWNSKMTPVHADFEARGLVEPGLLARIQAIE